eukprot:Skav214740  [mRNA]  locus=scaffold3176:133140:134285:- [translate_table: standard]
MSGQELGVLHLLFADDGWLTATGGFFWRKLLFWLFCLDVLEIPLSWKKVRGGTEVQWIGYTINVASFRIGISERKVQWMLEWLEKHMASGGITGRDLKSALGRFSFVAGALPHVRPFLGPIFAWAARLSPGVFATFPDAVVILLEYVMAEVKRNPMRKPRRLQDGARELFRIDAKAEGDCVVIGGWETLDELGTTKARWFSISLTRKNAPWVFTKGEPFRNIASLELMAVLMAVVIFGDRWEGLVQKGEILLTASTDNLGNTHVLRHFMSCKYPLSIVVMELALQLKEKGIELDLKWLPRGQNIEADALTNLEFDGFDMQRRVHVDIEKVDFLILNKLMEKAGSLDEEMKLARSSKEAKGDRPERDLPKRKRGETKWKDPW